MYAIARKIREALETGELVRDSEGVLHYVGGQPKLPTKGKQMSETCKREFSQDEIVYITSRIGGDALLCEYVLTGKRREVPTPAPVAAEPVVDTTAGARAETAAEVN